MLPTGITTFLEYYKKLFRLRLIIKIEAGSSGHCEVDPSLNFRATGCHHEVVAGLKI